MWTLYLWGEKNKQTTFDIFCKTVKENSDQLYFKMLNAHSSF